MAQNKLNLLIIEDSEYDADLLVHQLRRNGFELDYTLIGSADQVEQTLQDRSFDLVISDYNLSGNTSGIDALRRVKEFDSMLPFVLISGLVTADQENEILQLGANEVILKSNLNRLPYSIRRILYEVADKKKLQNLIHAKDMIMSIMSHDLKGMIEGIMVLAEFLQEDAAELPGGESIRESLDLIARSARSSSQMLDNLLNWTLVRIGAFEPEFKPINLTECLRLSVEAYRSRAAGKEISIELELSGPVTIRADWNMLSIVFRNLVSNAIKFSNPESRLRVRLEESAEHVTIHFTDQGIGIPPRIMKDLFDPDNRPRRPGTREEQSTGLGLLLSMDVVRLHNGTIEVESEEGHGSTFSVHLPKDPQEIS